MSLQRVDGLGTLSPVPDTELLYRGPATPWKPYEQLDLEPKVSDSAFRKLKSDERICPYGHALTFRERKCTGWACDGKDGLFGGFRTKWGCLSGITDFHQSGTFSMWECKICSYDVCEKCCDQIQTTYSSYNKRVWRLLQAKISESSDQSLSYKSNLTCVQCDANISEKEQQFIFFFKGQRYCSEYCRSTATHRAVEKAFDKLNEEPCKPESTIPAAPPTKSEKFLVWKAKVNEKILNLGMMTFLGSVLTGVTAVAWQVFFVSD